MRDAFESSRSLARRIASADKPLRIANARVRNAHGFSTRRVAARGSSPTQRRRRRGLDDDAGELFDRREAGEDLVHAVVPERAHAVAQRGRLQLVARRLLRRSGSRARRSSACTRRCRCGRGTRSSSSGRSRPCGRPAPPRAPRRAPGRCAARSGRPPRPRAARRSAGTASARAAGPGRRRRRRAVTNGSTPISFSRVTAPGASFVCMVERTKWPVSAASIEIRAVSPSRISPTITTSGSERRIERSAVAKVRPARGLICTWLTPGRRYSTGSSTVITLISGRLVSLRTP